MKTHIWARVALLLSLLCLATTVDAEPLVLEGGTVHPMTAEPFVGRIVVDDGLILAVGKGVPAPTGAKTLRIGGLHVYPGLFDSFSQIGLTEVGSVSATNDHTEMGMYNPHLDAATAIHPASGVIPVTRANGITHSAVIPRTDNEGVIPGRATIAHLDGWTVEEMAIVPSAALAIQWPAIVTRRFDFTTFSFKDTPYNEAKESAEKRVHELGEWMEAARHYRQATGPKNSRALRDLKLAALSEVFDGQLPVIITAQAKRDIEAAVKFSEQEGLRMILAGGREAWKVKDLLAEKKIPVILGRIQALPREQDAPYNRPFTAPIELIEAGVKIAFSSGAGSGRGGAHSARNLPYEAATAVANGLSEEDALKALTLWPAEILGVSDRLGSVEEGKIANLIVTDGSPLEITTQIHHVIIRGMDVPTANHHRDLYEKYRGRQRPQPAAVQVSGS